MNDTSHKQSMLLLVISIVCMTIALLLNSRLPFRNVLTGLMLLPWIVPEVVTAMAWRSIFDPIFGGLNPILLASFGCPEPRRVRSTLAYASGSKVEFSSNSRYASAPVGTKYW